MTDDPPPPRIPGLELGEQIGEGGTSVVYRAFHPTLRRGVAVKVFRGAPGVDPGGADGPVWVRESQLTAALAHPNVVAIHDAGQADGHPYLVLEEMAGGSLRARLTPGRAWPPDRAAAVLDQVARALEHVHARGVLHLDLKPENVLFAADGTVKVTDFGLSAPPDDTSALIHGRQFRGTLDYCSPEQRSGLPLDARSDVFSLATLAYELLTGRLPGRVYVPPSARVPSLSPDLDDVLRRGLAREPDDRFPSVAEFRREFAAATGTPRPRPVAWWPVTAAAVAVGIVVAVAVLLFNRAVPPSVASIAAGVIDPSADRPTRLWLLYDRPDDLDLFADPDQLDPPAERARVNEQAQGLPPDLPVPFAPKPLPVLVIRSAGAWGFVHPLADRTLARRVVADWPNVLRAAPPAGSNFVSAGGFDGDCLAVTRSDRSRPWRVGEQAEEKLAVGVPPGQPAGNPVLVLHHLPENPAAARKQIGSYQMLSAAPPPGSVAVLRYRVRVGQGSPTVAVYGSTSVALKGDPGAAAGRLRRLAEPAPREKHRPDAAGEDRWLYRVPSWVTPTAEWQTVVVVTEFPPPPAEVSPHQVVVDTTPGQAWVDDVDWFRWRPEGDPR